MTRSEVIQLSLDTPWSYLRESGFSIHSMAADPPPPTHSHTHTQAQLRKGARDCFVEREEPFVHTATPVKSCYVIFHTVIWLFSKWVRVVLKQGEMNQWGSTEQEGKKGETSNLGRKMTDIQISTFASHLRVALDHCSIAVRQSLCHLWEGGS